MGVLETERSWWRRTSAYEEISQYSFMEYFYAFALPYFAEQREDIDLTEEGARRLFQLSDLRSIEERLRKNRRAVVCTNENDFLLRPEDLDWIRRVFGNRARFFESGGHLGNLFRREIQQAIQQTVERVEKEGSSQP